MCETRDLEIERPHWHASIFGGDRRSDMRYVCPRDVKKMLVQQARSVRWKKWAAKHENEELKELEPALALPRKKTREDWTEKHRNVVRKLVGWAQKKLFDIGWSDESECQACHKAEGTENHVFYHCQEWYEIRRKIPEVFSKWEQKATTSKKEWSGKDVLSRILFVKANGTGVFSA